MSILHRYKSTIHGNYLKVASIYGLIVGVVLGLYVLVRLLSGHPLPLLVSIKIDLLFIVAIALLTYMYRNSLVEGKATFKELLLFGMCLGGIASLVYGLILVLIGMASLEQTTLSTNAMTNNTITADDQYLTYWAILLGIFSVLQMLLVSFFAAFLSAVFFKNEKAEPIKRK